MTTVQYPPPPPGQEPPPPGNNRGLLIGLIAVVTVLMLGIVGLGAWLILGDEDEPAPPTSSQPPLPEGPTAPPIDPGNNSEVPPPQQGQQYTDQDYIDAVESSLNIDYDDEQLVALGNEICGVLDQYGVDLYLQNINNLATDVGVTPGELLVITEAAVLTYCPEYY